jgi:xanthine/CO dehydrogenase XdhC/CoxF family maturation factor
MGNIYSELVHAVAAGEKCVLARIIRQIGSAPRTVGATLLVKLDGTIVGTIGGGALEHEVLRKAKEVMASGTSAVLHIRLTGQEVSASEMLCGGNVDVLVEPVFAEDAAAGRVFQELISMTAQGRCAPWSRVWRTAGKAAAGFSSRARICHRRCLVAAEGLRHRCRPMVERARAFAGDPRGMRRETGRFS